MNKLEYKKFRGQARKEAKGIAQGEFNKNPSILGVSVPYFQPFIASSFDRAGFIPIGNCELVEVVYDGDGNIIHEKWGKDWRFGTIEVKRSGS